MTFISPQAKREFTIKFGLILVLFFILQFLIPGLAFLALMFSTMKNALKSYDLIKVLQTKNQTYFLFAQSPLGFSKTRPPGNSQQDAVYWLYKVKKGSGFDMLSPATKTALKSNFKGALADDRGVWLLYPFSYEIFDGKNFKTFVLKYSVGNELISAIANNSIYVVYFDGDKSYLTTITDSKQEPPVEIPSPDFQASPENDRLLFYDNKLYHFARDQAEIYVQIIAQGRASSYNYLGQFPCVNYRPAYDSEGLFLVGSGYCSKEFPNESSVKVARIKGASLGELREIFFDEIHTAPVRSFGVLSSYKGSAKIFYNPEPAGMQRIKSNDLSSPTSAPNVYLQDMVQRDMYIMMPLFYGLPITIILLLAWIANSMFPKYRTTQVMLGNNVTYEFASVLRRSLAQLIDLAILYVPFILPFRILLLHMQPAEKPFLVIGWSLALSALNALLCLVYFTVLESRWGLTLGKLALKIQVLEENGKPPSFGGALLRNILKIIDGFFSAAIGIALIAFTDNWQRLGDLAARTVVVRRL